MNNSTQILNDSCPLYLNDMGIYQKEYSDLCDTLVPSSGHSNTLHGELIRYASNFYHEYFNNGNINVVDFGDENCADLIQCPECSGEAGFCDDDGDLITCYNCDDSGSVYEYGKVIYPHYMHMRNFITKHISDRNGIVAKLTSFILEPDAYADSPHELYDSLVDMVMEYVLNIEDRELTVDEVKTITSKGL